MFLFPLNLGVSPCFHCTVVVLFTGCILPVPIIQLLVPVTGYIVPVSIMQVLLLVSVWTGGFNLFLKCVIRQELVGEYTFSEFATPSCKWGKIVCLQCKSNKFVTLLWGTTCNLISHICLFFITRLRAHHKNKSNSLETRLWKDISHQTLRLNSYGKI